MKKLTKHEQEIHDLNAVLLQMKDEHNAISAERDKYKAALETLLEFLTKLTKASPRQPDDILRFLEEHNIVKKNDL